MLGYLGSPATQGVHWVKYGFQYLWRRSPSVKISKNIYVVGVTYFVEKRSDNTPVSFDVLDIVINSSFL